MAEVITVERKIFGKDSFSTVIDTKFNQLVPSDPTITSPPPTTVEKFFEDYNTLFYDIPPSGSVNSHEELVIKSSEYIGISLENLEEEIRVLREENVYLKNQLLTLSNAITG